MAAVPPPELECLHLGQDSHPDQHLFHHPLGLWLVPGNSQFRRRVGVIDGQRGRTPTFMWKPLLPKEIGPAGGSAIAGAWGWLERKMAIYKLECESRHYPSFL